MKTFICIMMFILIAAMADAQPAMFAGYDAFCGLPVIVGQTSQSAVATFDQQGNRVILVDPSVMSNWSLSRMFVLAHECGHHILGHLSPSGRFSRQRFNGTRQQELAADCWAAEVLAANGHYDEIERTIRQDAGQGPIMQGPYPSGMERAQYIAQCAGINLPPPGFPPGYGMQVCGCWGFNPPTIAPEPRCQSGQIRVNPCQGFCPSGGSPYAYVCQ